MIRRTLGEYSHGSSNNYRSFYSSNVINMFENVIKFGF